MNVPVELAQIGKLCLRQTAILAVLCGRQSSDPAERND